MDTSISTPKNAGITICWVIIIFIIALAIGYLLWGKGSFSSTSSSGSEGYENGKSNNVVYYIRHNQCPFCKNFDEVWNKLNMSGTNKKIIAVETQSGLEDLQKLSQLVGQSIDSAPTLVFQKGENITVYRGNNTIDDITKFANSFF